MCNRFALTRKSRFKIWLDDQVKKMIKFCIFFIEFSVLGLEKMASWVNDRASQYLILTVAKRDVPRLISVLRTKNQLSFEGLARRIIA